VLAQERGGGTITRSAGGGGGRGGRLGEVWALEAGGGQGATPTPPARYEARFPAQASVGPARAPAGAGGRKDGLDVAGYVAQERARRINRIWGRVGSRAGGQEAGSAPVGTAEGCNRRGRHKTGLPLAAYHRPCRFYGYCFVLEGLGGKRRGGPAPRASPLRDAPAGTFRPVRSTFSRAVASAAGG